jgi:hypothetical protein
MPQKYFVIMESADEWFLVMLAIPVMMVRALRGRR